MGFSYPVVDQLHCVDCHLCERVCPFLNETSPCEPVECLAAASDDDDIRRASSSGGIFTLLASDVISRGGVVFGARFDTEWAVRHDYAVTLEGIVPLCRSKYVQSVIGDSFKLAERFLEQGREVLFTGTPCQIAALRLYLGKKCQSGLFSVEVVCHGVPSPKVWKEYLRFKSKGRAVSVVNFRDKSTGWRNYSLRINKWCQHHDFDHYMVCFLSNCSLRPSCFNCPAKSGRSGSDITLGDLWGVERLAPSLSDNRGTSLVVVNTEAGKALIERCGIPRTAPVDYRQAVAFNHAIDRSSTKYSNDYAAFWQMFSQNPLRAIRHCGRRNQPSLTVRIKRYLIRLLH